MVKQMDEEIGTFKGDWGEAYLSPGPVAPDASLLQRAEEQIKVDAPQKVIDLAKKEPKAHV